MSEKLMNALDSYREKFSDQFPMAAVTLSDDEVIETIGKCIASNTPFDPKYKNDCLY